MHTGQTTSHTFNANPYPFQVPPSNATSFAVNTNVHRLGEISLRNQPNYNWYPISSNSTSKVDSFNPYYNWYPISSNSTSKVDSFNPYKMYLLSKYPAEIEFTDLAAEANGDLYDGHKEIVIEKDSLLHIAIREMVSNRRNFQYSRLEQLIEKIAQNHSFPQLKRYIFRKNSRNEGFYEIQGLTSLEKSRLYLSVVAALNPDTFQRISYLRQNIMDILLNFQFVQIEKTIKASLTEFIIISKIYSDPQGGNILHWLVKHYWEKGGESKLIKLNIGSLKKFLKNSPSQDSLENDRLSQLLTEQNSDGLTWKQLNKSLQKKHLLKDVVNEGPIAKDDKAPLQESSSSFCELIKKAFFYERPIKWIRKLKTIEDDFKCTITEDLPMDVNLKRQYSSVIEYQVECLLQKIFFQPLEARDIGVAVLLKCLSLRFHDNLLQKNIPRRDRLLHFLVRLKHRSGPLLKAIIEGNIKLIETTLNYIPLLNIQERSFFLDAKNAEGLDYRQLNDQLQLEAQTKRDDKGAFQTCISVEYPISDRKFALRSFASNDLYNWALSPSFLNSYYTPDFLSVYAAYNGITKEGELINEGDTILHILVRHLCNSDQAPRYQMEKLLLYIISNYAELGKHFLKVKNSKDESFWQVDGLSEFEVKWLSFWESKIDKVFSKNKNNLIDSELFIEKFLNDFCTLEFNEIFESLKHHLSDFALHSKSFSDLFSKSTVLHKIANKIWGNGTKNELIYKNLFYLKAFLESKPSPDPLVNDLFENLLNERNREGQTFSDLCKERCVIVPQHNQYDSKSLLTQKENYLIIYYTEQARELLQSDKVIDPQSKLQCLFTEAINNLISNLSEAQREQQDWVTQKFRKTLTKAFNSLVVG